MKRIAKSMASGGRAKWGIAWAVAFLVAAMTSARAWAQEAEAGPGEMSGLSWWQETLERLRPSNDSQWLGLGAMVFALGLIASASYLARSRRRFAVLVGCVLIFGVGGYVLYDRYYIDLNLFMRRDITNLRADCERLLRNRGSMTLKPGYKEIVLEEEELPESMRRLGMAAVIVYQDAIVLHFMPSGGPGILYDPHHTYPGWEKRREKMRQTFFPGFYLYDGLIQ